MTDHRLQGGGDAFSQGTSDVRLCFVPQRRSPKMGNHPGLVTAHRGRDTTVLLSICAAAEKLQAGLSCTGLRLSMSDPTDLTYKNLAHLPVCLNNHPCLSPGYGFQGRHDSKAQRQRYSTHTPISSRVEELCTPLVNIMRLSAVPLRLISPPMFKSFVKSQVLASHIEVL